MPSRKGSPNRNKAFLLNRLQEMYGEDFHPILQIAKNCVELQSNLDDTVAPVVDTEKNITAEDVTDYKTARVTAISRANSEWSRIAEYTEPKLKAVELTGKDGEAIQLDAIWEVKVIE